MNWSQPMKCEWLISSDMTWLSDLIWWELMDWLYLTWTNWTDWAISSDLNCLNWLTDLIWSKLIEWHISCHLTEWCHWHYLMWTNWTHWTDWVLSSDLNSLNWLSKFIWSKLLELIQWVHLVERGRLTWTSKTLAVTESMFKQTWSYGRELIVSNSIILYDKKGQK